MNDLQRHQFGALCEALYRKEREVNHQNDEADTKASPVTMTAETEPQYVRIPKYAVGTAVRQAKQAVEEINAKLRDAERERDELARKLGSYQDMVDRLTGERNYRTKHVRALLGSIEDERGPEHSAEVSGAP